MSNTDLQSQMIASQQNLKEKEYWMSKFSGDFVRSHFPYDHPLSEGKGKHLPEKLRFEFPKEIAERLLAISNGSDVRLFILFATAVTALLDKYTDNRDITVGVPIYKQDVEGEFINTAFALRNAITEGMTFKEFLMSVSRSVLEANEHQNYSINTLMFNLDMHDTGGPFPLFDVAVMMENIHREQDIRHTRPSVLFSFAKADAGITGHISYNAALYEAGTIQRIQTHLVKLLQETVFQIDVPLQQVDILSEQEREQIVYGFNDTASEFPAHLTIHGAVEQQAAQTPEAIAIVAGDVTLTYRQLNEKANRLARLLQEKGVAVEHIVAVMFDRSLDLVVSLLSILKAGAAYMPIDPELPQERITGLLEDCGASLLLTNTATLESHGAAEPTTVLEGVELLRLDQLEGELAQFAGDDLNVDMSVENLAYVLYTSGSTGKPKGVMVEHRNAMNVLHWFQNTADLQAGDRVLLTYEYTSDPSIEDIFATWMCGATLYVTDKYMVIDRAQFRAFVNEQRITILNFVPRMIQELLCNGEKLDSLHTVLSGGEVLENKVKDELLRIGYKVFNDYGPTEASVDCLSQTCSERAVTIGRPIQNMRAYVLDKHNGIKPLGVPGELCIAGVGVVRGYLNRPDLTAEKFVADPFVEGGRMYRTGDLARLLPNGEVEFLGRFDHQVKIRGYRVELGEIEHQLMKFDHVKEAFVTLRDDGRREKWICAYVVPEGDLSLSDLKWFLVKTLPDYMIPAQVIAVDDIPLTPTGKVDVKALPDPVELAGDEVLGQPETDTEKVLAGIWREVLGHEAIGLHSNYFEIGGHSLNIIQVRAKINQQLGQDVSIVTLFQYPTIQSLARYLNGETEEVTRQDDGSDVEQLDETLDILRGFTS